MVDYQSVPHICKYSVSWTIIWKIDSQDHRIGARLLYMTFPSRTVFDASEATALNERLRKFATHGESFYI